MPKVEMSKGLVGMVKKRMIDRDLDKPMLAEKTGLSVPTISTMLREEKATEKTINKVTDALNITEQSISKLNEKYAFVFKVRGIIKEKYRTLVRFYEVYGVNENTAKNWLTLDMGRNELSYPKARELCEFFELNFEEEFPSQKDDSQVPGEEKVPAPTEQTLFDSSSESKVFFDDIESISQTTDDCHDLSVFTDDELKAELKKRREKRAESRGLVPLPEQFLDYLYKKGKGPKTWDNLGRAVYDYILEKALNSVKTEPNAPGYIEITLDELRHVGVNTITMFKLVAQQIINFYIEIPENDDSVIHDIIPIFEPLGWFDYGYDGRKHNGPRGIALTVTNRVVEDWQILIQMEENND